MKREGNFFINERFSFSTDLLEFIGEENSFSDDAPAFVDHLATVAPYFFFLDGLANVPPKALTRPSRPAANPDSLSCA